MTILLDADMVPSYAKLGTNARTHGNWRLQASHTRQAKADWYAAFACKVQMYQDRRDQHFPWERVRISILITWPDRRRRDYDNAWAALKPMIDVLCAPSGIRDHSPRLGVIQADHWPVLVSATLTFRYQKDTMNTVVSINRA